jgi:hypothetical protein
MPLVPTSLKSAIEAQLITAFTREFADATASNPEAAGEHAKLAAAISDIAIPIIKALTTEAQVIVQPGIATAGSPAAQTTVSPGTGTIT